MKHGNSYYIQLTRDLFYAKSRTLSDSAFRLFVVLNEAEHGFEQHDGWFFRKDEELAEACNMSLSKLRRAKAELLKTDLITTKQKRPVNPSTGIASKKHITHYKILK